MTEEASKQPELLPPAPPETPGMSTKELVSMSTGQESLARRDGGSWSFDPAAFALAQQQAKALANSSLLPRHLTHQGNQALAVQQVIANCLFLVADAWRWRVNPYALLPECYPRPGGGGMAYQGKVIAGILNKHLGIRLAYKWTGEGEDRACTCVAQLPGEDFLRSAEVVFKNVKTHDKDGRLKAAWTKDLDQKLSYNAVIKWGRLHAPELVTGVITAEEAELMEQERRSTAAVAPQPTGATTPPSLVAFAQAASPASPAVGSSQAGEPDPPSVPGAGAAGAAPPSAPAPGPSSPDSKPKPITRRALEELIKLAKDQAGLERPQLEQLAVEKCEGRTLTKLYESDCLPLVQEVQRLSRR